MIRRVDVVALVLGIVLTAVAVMSLWSTLVGSIDWGIVQIVPRWASWPRGSLAWHSPVIAPDHPRTPDRKARFMTNPSHHRRLRRLERSRSNRVLGGVCGGVATYLNMDPTLVRVLTVVLTLFTGVPVVVYLVLLLVVPEEGSDTPPNVPPGYQGGVSQTIPATQQPAGDPVWGPTGAPWEQPAPTQQPPAEPAPGPSPVRPAAEQREEPRESSGSPGRAAPERRASLATVRGHLKRRARVPESSGAPGGHRSSPGGNLWPAASPDGPR